MLGILFVWIDTQTITCNYFLLAGKIRQFSLLLSPFFLWYLVICQHLSVPCSKIIIKPVIGKHQRIHKLWPLISNWAPSSEFVSSSIPSWQILTAHAQPFRGARDLAFCLKVPLDSLLLFASSEGSGETARMRRLAWTFAARICYKYQIRLTRSNYNCFIYRSPWESWEQNGRIGIHKSAWQHWKESLIDVSTYGNNVWFVMIELRFQKRNEIDKRKKKLRNYSKRFSYIYI